MFDTNRIAVPDFVVIAAWMALSKRVRDHIEAIEPGRNEYFPFELARKKSKKPLMGPDGNLLTDPYYLLNVTTRIDAVRIDRSVISPMGRSAQFVFALPYRLNEIVLDKSMVAGHHVWKGNKHLTGKVLFSNELGEWIIRNKMRGLEMTHLREE
ncbi:MAG: hypothetical protein DCF31_16350 [Alphaproteobacteria bacterium]|nr:MAG: hypothetical protein DCF31_16350 [Alphaproteobacteria bacterium]